MTDDLSSKLTGSLTDQPNKTTPVQSGIISRRSFLAATAGVAAAGCEVSDQEIGNKVTHAETTAAERRTNAPQAPFDTLREYVAAIEAHGLLLRFDKIDQDVFEGTAIIYALIDKYGWYDAPAVLFERIKQEGVWIKGPIVINHQGHWDTECITFGLEPVKGNSRESYKKALTYTRNLLVNGKFPQIAPVEVTSKNALCKQVIETGDDIDITKFAFITSNPADGGRYINTGSVFTSDPEMGTNYGTYRCQIRGPRVLGVNPEPNQTGWKMLMAAKDRGEETAKISIALGQDPYVWLVSGSKVAPRFGRKVTPIDEIAVAGGIRGKAIEVVKSETNDIMVPANCEMIIEGEVPLQEAMLPEGPFGEMYGYLGRKKPENFWMNITAVSYRKDPWFMNQFTGVTRGYVTAPVSSLFNESFSKMIPGLIEIHQPVDTTGWCFIKIKKTEPGQGLKAGKRLASIVPLFKVTIVVDEDVDILNWYEVGLAVGARYTPATATEIFSGRGMPLDPSASAEDRYASSKLVIDATKQWPEEGGPENYAELNRALLEKLAPDAFDIAIGNWGDAINSWGKTRY
ncbi:MAG: UbiD family decarboxylase [Gammaproteobacteria bacterium]|nr:UbiD family decarboxylase [Gammaproteobacteria bacterium]MCP4928777.1 UbiD family decarboxylase [Gammaproteobacteria bacterium]